MARSGGPTRRVCQSPVNLLLLVSFLIAIVAGGILFLGLLQQGLGLIYVSIGASLCSGICLAIAVLKAGKPDRFECEVMIGAYNHQECAYVSVKTASLTVSGFSVVLNGETLYREGI